jgi:predicted transcriptional regulator
MPTEIGAQIYSRRKSLRWCRYTLAERSSVGRSQIKAIEEGWGQPHAESVRKVIECITAAEVDAQDKPSSRRSL